jgi:hypothetical protein
VAIERGNVRVACAIDAACEGLNLQRLCAPVNMDLPCDPSRLEQRKDWFQRIGQARDEVHILRCSVGTVTVENGV